jgi:glyoxylase-like metal-dependent hydrolase (beta-lactamase superfamily II)
LFEFEGDRKQIFTGDVLFAGAIGRTDLPGSSPDDMDASLRDVVLQLPDSALVYPGHGPASDMATEKASNEYLLRVASGLSAI